MVAFLSDRREANDTVKVQREWLFLSVRYEGRLPGWGYNSAIPCRTDGILTSNISVKEKGKSEVL